MRVVVLAVIAGCASSGENGSSSYESPPGSDWTHVEVGEHNLSCGMQDSGRADCWGFDVSGGGSVPEGPFVDIAVGLELCGVRADGDVVCGERNQKLTPSRRPAETEGSWVTIAGGRDGFCGITSDGTLDCVGYPGVTWPEGEGYVALDGRYDVYCAIAVDQSIRCWDMRPSDSLGAPVFPDGGYIDVDVGCALTIDGRAVCAGEGPPDTATYLDVSVGDGVCAIREDGTIGCWEGWYDADADLPTRSGYVEVAAGSVQGCALHETGSIDCWEVPYAKK